MMTEEFITAVCAEFNIEIIDLKGKRRSRRLNDIRQACWWVLRYRAKLKKVEIARLMNRDHSTISTGIQSIDGAAETDFEAAGILDKAENIYNDLKTEL